MRLIDNFLNIIFTTNNPMPIKKEPGNNRRFTYFLVNWGKKLATDYMTPKMVKDTDHENMESVKYIFYFLYNLKLGDFHPRELPV